MTRIPRSVRVWLPQCYLSEMRPTARPLLHEIRSRPGWRGTLQAVAAATTGLSTGCALDWTANATVQDAGISHDSGVIGDAAPSDAETQRQDDAHVLDAEDSGTGGEPDGSVPELPLPACADGRLEQLGTFSSSTDGAGDQLMLSCAASAGNDLALHWVVPKTGYYELTTKGSNFDNVLGIVSAACNGTEYACEHSSEPRIVRRFEAGEEYVVVVDGVAGSHGAVELGVHRVTCPANELSADDLPFTSTTAFGTSAHDGICGGAGERERSLLWTAPSAGLYAFTVTSHEFDPVLYVEEGPRCGGPLLGCNAGGRGMPRSQVTRRVKAGELLTLIVDSGDGAGVFTLDVEKLSTPCPTFARDPIEDPPVDGTLEPDAPSLLTATCLPTSQSVIPGGTYDRADHSFAITVPAGYGCSVFVEADKPIGLYVIEGTQCAGYERKCLVGDEGPSYFATTNFGEFTSDVDSHWVVVVEAAFPNEGTVAYTLSSGCFIP